MKIGGVRSCQLSLSAVNVFNGTNVDKCGTYVCSDTQLCITEVTVNFCSLILDLRSSEARTKTLPKLAC